jgi:hypothetical protein
VLVGLGITKHDQHPGTQSAVWQAATDLSGLDAAAINPTLTSNPFTCLLFAFYRS